MASGQKSKKMVGPKKPVPAQKNTQKRTSKPKLKKNITKKGPPIKEPLKPKEGDEKMKIKSEKKGIQINLSDKIWRLMAMIAFSFIGYFALLLMILLAAMQFIVVLLNEEVNPEIKLFMDRIGIFISQVFKFLSYNTEEMPFPFASFPDGISK